MCETTKILHQHKLAYELHVTRALTFVYLYCINVLSSFSCCRFIQTILLKYLDNYIPRERSSGGGGGYKEKTPSVRLSLRLFVQIRVRPITFI